MLPGETINSSTITSGKTNKGIQINLSDFVSMYFCLNDVGDTVIHMYLETMWLTLNLIV